MRKAKIIKQEMEVEISLNYNAASKEKRKEFDEDVFYKLCLKDKDFEAALGRANEIFFGSARDMEDMRRQMKMKRKLEEEKLKLEQDMVLFLANMPESARADFLIRIRKNKK
jgi:hypothetical protein